MRERRGERERERKKEGGMDGWMDYMAPTESPWLAGYYDVGLKGGAGLKL